ncbi:hypothetical protein [Alicyclobacillus sp. ALC3]|uniref:hypothetical protein n=1 Tax=Alicyclobacillus sp. ALC3 TaxID=2796143 RepID=UPI002378337E|nr:hypothetical protein [Alicyclobacillus sp. ALC3]WDL97823.1 hypothetical protein JC200_03570 [Alicyclobacillus sp. ALC3]
MDEQLWVVWFKGDDGWHATGPWTRSLAQAVYDGMMDDGVSARITPRHTVTNADITE